MNLLSPGEHKPKKMTKEQMAFVEAESKKILKKLKSQEDIYQGWL